MIPCSDDVHHMTDESLATFHRNRKRLPWKQRQHEFSSKANRQLVKRIRPSSSGATDLRISSPNTFTRNGSKLNECGFSLNHPSAGKLRQLLLDNDSTPSSSSNLST
ncbi:unnamed protein product [Protopolystoma xenopodis]|uniref:Uncharacterized protein n=1 Tax=Protopolystoma xenopodis TaxID=117903 RepID=A0A3S5BRK6_9PLAT|nr:unnamed protein product [Protopolystoma xenopodis]